MSSKAEPYKEVTYFDDYDPSVCEEVEQNGTLRARVQSLIHTMQDLVARSPNVVPPLKACVKMGGTNKLHIVYHWPQYDLDS